LNPDGGFNYVHDGSETTTDSFTYVANDGTADSNQATVTININPVNDLPVANAGPDQTLTDTDGSGAETVTLDGSASSDPDGTITSYEWKEGTTVLGSTSSITLDLTVGVHDITLTVTDNNLGVGSDTVQVRVNSQTPPPPSDIFFDNLQSGFGKWTESNEFDWNMEKPSERNISGYPSTNTVAHADECTSAVGCILTMKNPIDLIPYGSATLTFWRYVDNDLDAGEFLKVEAYDGTTWNTIFTWTNGAGADDIWRKETVDLTSYLGTSNFNLRFISKESNYLEATEIDDVLIKGGS
jgi:hypothetical protein